MRTLRIDAATGEVFSALREKGIASIVLKGPSVARWLYDSGRRQYGDCDLLVRESDLSVAQQSLLRLGFERRGLYTIRGDWPRHAAAYRRGDVTVDLHRTLLGVKVEADGLWDALAPHREPMPVGGVDVDVLDPAGRAMVLALHAAKDGGRDEKPLIDLERALDSLPFELWRMAADIATEVGAIDAFAAGLRRCPAGHEVWTLLGLRVAMSPEIALREQPPPAMSAGVDWLLRTRGARGKMALIARKLVPPPSFLRDWSPLARRGRWGLALAYLWRPMWVAWNAFPAVMAVVRARAKARRSAAEPASVAARLPVWSKVVLAARIWWVFLEVVAVERRHPLPQVTERLALGPKPAGRSVEPRRLGRIVGRVLRIGRWQPRCLFSALVLYRMLHEQGDPAELVIGLHPQPLSKDAHAWVEVGGLDVGPPPGGRGHVPLARYP
jgi:Uncharacterised nucleotidyltransferase/Transglutaminase-like superfamily